MPVDVLMPKLGLTMTEGTILQWVTGEGEAVHVGQILFEIETEKAVTEVEAQTQGTLSSILAPAGTTIAVGAVVGRILLPGETPPNLAPTSSLPSLPLSSPLVSPISAPSIQLAPPRADEKKVSPLARRLAKELGIDVANISGTGPEGRIVEEDVRQHALGMPTPTTSDLEPKSWHITPFSGLRRLIADRMMSSLQSTAQVTLFREVDATDLVYLRSQWNSRRLTETPLKLNDFLICAVARSLRIHPALNARLEDDAIRQIPSIHVGLAVDHERGLLVPVIRDAASKTIEQIHADLNLLLEAIHSNRISPDALSGSTFTITNLGSLGIDAFTPILNPPECGILGVGRIIAKQVVRGEQNEVVVRRMMMLSLTFDHRLVDGADAARFLKSVAEKIETPSFS